MLEKNDKCIDPEKIDKDIHTLPITCLKSSSDYTFSELVSLYIKKTDKYFAKYGSLNDKRNVNSMSSDNSRITSSMVNEVDVTLQSVSCFKTRL
uniref:hypothetical protein n=1 Tax=Wolbachia endosymbiont of Pentidionis agamae TaxID=3110435 RepID=UPI002FCEE0AB